MRHFTRLLIVFCSLYAANAFATYNVFFEPLYWRATETLDWEHSNNLTTPNLIIGFKAPTYNAAPGFRLGVGYLGALDTKFYYTQYYTNATAATSGNLTSEFLGGRLSQTIPTTIFYQTGQADYSIHFYMFDWDIGKHFNVTNALMLRPLIGLEAGIINQNFNTSFQSPSLSVRETIANDFKGIGPKIGIESTIEFWRVNDYRYSLIASFTSSYLWGHWNITDEAQTNTGNVYNINVAPRNMGALSLQGMLGLGFNYKDFSAKIGYEISDWFDQCQIFDDETGTQNNDLVLQGLTLGFSYSF